jgi:hypothetical protein
MPNRPKKKSNNMSEETQTPGAPEVNIGDFGAILQIIDVASTRGAFKGQELSSVGQIRDRVAAFVDFYTPKEDEKKEENETNEATTTGAEATEETSE